jgi:hypothetical protein
VISQGLQNSLNKLWESKISEINFDILNNRIKMRLELTENKNISNHTIVLKNVSSYFFVNNTEKERKKFINREEDDFLEMTSISLIEGDAEIRTKAEEKWIEQYNANANIAIEIWSRFLFVETEMIEIDSCEYGLI